MNPHVIKPVTLSHYEGLVLSAVQRIVASLDQALDLQDLAAPACMAPLHFHRVFRGLIGETPLQLHRRLRLERAAWRLATQDESVLRIALDAGYETHESFTRAFRESFGRSPTEHRLPAPAQTPQGARQAAARKVSHRLQAACGLHGDGPAVDLPADPASLFTHHGASSMNVQIENRPQLRVAALRHTGPYNTIPVAFAKLGAIAGPAGLFGPDAQMVALYFDDPESVSADQLRSAAGVTVKPGMALPAALQEMTLPAGRWASALHRGVYSGLGDAWQRLLGHWLPHSGHRLASSECYELYLNHPGNAQEADLQTRLYAPLLA